jgi:hypothetical protein
LAIAVSTPVDRSALAAPATPPHEPEALNDACAPTLVAGLSNCFVNVVSPCTVSTVSARLRGIVSARANCGAAAQRAPIMPAIERVVRELMLPSP